MEKQVTRVPVKPTLERLQNVAAYARVSSGKDAMLHSLAAQVSYYSQMIREHPGWRFAGIYADEAMTGTKDTREEFQRLLTDCRAGKIDMVITKSVSRFARNTVTSLETVRELKLLGVDVYFEEQKIHSLSGDGELMLTILSAFAQEESKSASDNQRWRIRKGFEDGELMCLRTMFGYRISKEDGIEIDPEQAQIVREIYARVIRGETLNSIARWLNRNDIHGTRPGFAISSATRSIQETPCFRRCTSTIILRRSASGTKARFLNTMLRKHIRRSLIKPPLMRRRKLLRGLRHVIRRAATSSIMPSRA